MPESVQSFFELSIHSSVQQTSRELLLKTVRGKKIQGNVWKETVIRPIKNADKWVEETRCC